jgi:hypothetical protein
MYWWNHQPHRLSACRIACFALAGILCGSVVQGQESKEYPIKAAYLYNLAVYTEWPKTSFPKTTSPFVIGTLGTASLDRYLTSIASKRKIHGRPIKHLKVRTARDLEQCHILFLSSGVAEKSLQTAFKTTAGKPVLLVGETGAFIGQGGSVRFLFAQNRIRLQIANKTLLKRKLKVSSKLLQVAESVDR